MPPPLHRVVQYLRHFAGPLRSDALGDRHLLAAFAGQHDEAAFAELVRRHGPLVRGVCRRVLGADATADDAFQATFLLLARKAGSSGSGDSVAGWLHTAAWHIAHKARRAAERRQHHEGRAAPPTAADDPATTAAWRELCQVLDEELTRLPERLRAPLVLCYLEGQTRDEAARRLGCSLTTLKRRINRGRDLLRARLTRRGATLGAGLFATALLPAEAATVAVSPLLARATVDTAVAFAAGRAVAEPILQLAEEGLHMMCTSKLKVVVALVIVAGGLAGGIGALPGRVQDEPKRDPPAPQAVAAPDATLPAGAVLRHGEPNFRHGTEIINLLVTPDGKTLLTQGKRSVRLWDAATGRDQGSLDLPDDGPDFWTASLTPDARTLLTTRRNGTGQVWDLASRRLTRTFRLAAPPLDLTGGNPRCVHAPDGRTIAVAASDGSLHVCDVTQGRELDHLRSYSDGVTAVAYTPDSKQLCLASETGLVQVWDLTTGKRVTSTSLQDGVTNLIVSADGVWLAGAVATKPAKPGDTPGNAIVLHRKGSDSINQLWAPPSFASEFMAFSPDGNYILAPGERSQGRIVFQWDVQSGRSMRQFPGHGDRVHTFAFTPDGKTLITADDALHFWDWKTGQELREPPRRPMTGRGYALTPDGRAVAESDDAGTVHLWDATTGRELRRFEPSRPSPETTLWVNALAVSPDGRVLAAQGGALPEEGTNTISRPYVWVWDVATGRQLHRWNDVPGATTPRGGGGGGKAGGGGGKGKAPPSGRSGRGSGLDPYLPSSSAATSATAANPLAFSPDSRLLASSRLNRSILVWDVASGRETATLWSGYGSAIAYMPDGQHMVVWTGGNYVGRIDPSLPQPEQAVVQGVAGTVVFSTDGSRLADLNSGGPRGPFSVRIFDTGNGEILGQLRNLPQPVARIAFGSDGKMIATISTDESPTITVWDLATGQEVKRFRGLRGRAVWLAFAPDGQRLFSASTDTTVLVWDLSSAR